MTSSMPHVWLTNLSSPSPTGCRLKEEDLIVVAHDPVDAMEPPRPFALGPEIQHANTAKTVSPAGPNGAGFQSEIPIGALPSAIPTASCP